MKKALVILLILATGQTYAMSNSGSKAYGKAIYQQSIKNSSLNTNPNTDRNCYYCYKNMDTQYNPSYKKYSKTL